MEPQHPHGHGSDFFPSKLGFLRPNTEDGQPFEGPLGNLSCLTYIAKSQSPKITRFIGKSTENHGFYYLFAIHSREVLITLPGNQVRGHAQKCRWNAPSRPSSASWLRHGRQIAAIAMGVSAADQRGFHGSTRLKLGWVNSLTNKNQRFGETTIRIRNKICQHQIQSTKNRWWIAKQAGGLADRSSRLLSTVHTQIYNSNFGWQQLLQRLAVQWTLWWHGGWQFFPPFYWPPQKRKPSHVAMVFQLIIFLKITKSDDGHFSTRSVYICSFGSTTPATSCFLPKCETQKHHTCLDMAMDQYL